MPRRKPANGVAWEPPPDNPDKPDWEGVAKELKRHPMEWMKVYTNNLTSWYTAVHTGHIAVVHPDKGFETSTTDNTRDTPRTCTLYMRFNPERESK